MSENNLPIKLVLQKSSDVIKNSGGGRTKFFGEVTPKLQAEITDKFKSLLAFYEDVFAEGNIPAVGKITVKSEAIAKSHRPSELCRNCPIIGSEDLNEIYIKINEKNVKETIELVKNPPSKKFKANLTAIEDIQPIKPEEKISPMLRMVAQENFDSIKNEIKIKVFDFDGEFDNAQIWDYVKRKLQQLNLDDKCKIISYGEHIKFLKIEVKSYDDIIRLASINGVKTVGFFSRILPSSKKRKSLCNK